MLSILVVIAGLAVGAVLTWDQWTTPDLAPAQPPKVENPSAATQTTKTPLPASKPAPATSTPPRTNPERPTQVNQPHLDSLRQLIATQLAELKSRAGTNRDPDKLFQRNLGVYFATWVFAKNNRDATQFSDAFRDAAVDYADRLLQALRHGTPATRTIDAEDVRTVQQNFIPVDIDPWGELLFFPKLETAEQIMISGWDLEYFNLTGRSWVILDRVLGESDRAKEVQHEFSTEAVHELGRSLDLYLLALLRLSGQLAKEEKAPALLARHLQRAEVAMIDRRQRHKDAIGAPPSAPVKGTWFVDVTKAANIDFRHENTEWVERFRREGHLLPTDADGGVTAADLDQDGWCDLIFCGAQGLAIYHNQTDGTFENVTEQSQVAVPGEARMAIAADFDNDGIKDLFVTYAKDSNRIFRGLGDLQWHDATIDSGLENPGFLSGPTCTFDYDRDGLLDLYVGNFGNFLEGVSPYQTKDNKNAQPNQLFHNLGGFKFQDVTAASGTGDIGWCQAVSHCDFDGDGFQDLYVTNDFGRNDLLRNLGDGRFESVGHTTRSDDPWHGMNVCFGDLNHDWIPDVFITNIWEMNNVRRLPQEWNVLLTSQAQGDGLPKFRATPVGQDRMLDTGWSWGALFFDADNDADDDLYCVNGLTGYLYHYAEREHPTQRNQYYPYFYHHEPNHFYRNEDGTLVQASAGSGTELPHVNSRGLATLDYDRDGDVDLIVSTYHAPPALLRNDLATGRWLRLKLVGDPGQSSNRDAIGATVRATTASGRRIWRQVTGGEGFLSMSSLVLEFGLGDAATIDLEIHWPGGQVQTMNGVTADQELLIEQ